MRMVIIQGTETVTKASIDRHIPALDWLIRYPKDWLRPDLIAGLTTAAVVIPRAMVYAAIAGLPLELGLYTALVPMVIYAVMGTSRPLSVSTTTAIAILTAREMTQLAPDGDGTRLVAAAATLALLTGGILLLASMLKLGFLANFISAPVLTGFRAGIGVVIIVDQIPKLLGLHFEKGPFFHNLLSIVRHLPESSIPTFVLGLIMLAGIVGMEKFAAEMPAPLVAVIAGIAAAALGGLDRFGVELVGSIRSGFPSFALPDPSLAPQLWPGALGIALMSFVESAAAGRAFVRPGELRPNPNQELLALGLANLTGSMFRIMPAGGGTSQTAVSRAAGARSQVAVLVAAAAVAATLLFLAPVIALIPQAVLAAVVVATTAGLVSPAEFRAIRRIRRMEFRWAAIGLGGVVLFGTLEGVLIAVTVSILVLMYHASTPPVYALGRKPGTDVFRPLSLEHPNDETFPGLLLRTEGRINFLNVQHVGDRMWVLIRETKPQVLVLDCSAIPDFEYTAVKGLSVFEAKLREEGTILWLAALNPGVLQGVDLTPIDRHLGKDRMFFNLEHAVNVYKETRWKQAWSPGLTSVRTRWRMTMLECVGLPPPVELRSWPWRSLKAAARCRTAKRLSQQKPGKGCALDILRKAAGYKQPKAGSRTGRCGTCARKGCRSIWLLASNENKIPRYAPHNGLTNSGHDLTLDPDCPADDGRISWNNQNSNYPIYWLRSVQVLQRIEPEWPQTVP